MYRSAVMSIARANWGFEFQKRSQLFQTVAEFYSSECERMNEEAAACTAASS